MFDFPNTPTSGQVVNGPNGATWQWDGTKWLANALWQGATVIVSDVAPANPPAGALWWDSVGGQLYLNYHDPNSTEWVIANTGGIPDAPTDGNIYGRQSQLWVSITPSIAASPNNTGRNLLHNAMFNIQQRGTGPWTTNAVFTADRWALYIVNDTTSVSLTTARAGGINAVDDFISYISANVTGSATAGSYSQIVQRMEGVARLSNKTVTVSIRANVSSGTPKLGIAFAQIFGTSGSASVGVPSQYIALSTANATYSLTFNIPSTAGKTIGAGDCTQLSLNFSSANDAVLGAQTATFNISAVQVELGSVATPFVRRDPADDLALCQRFYVGPLPYNFSGYNLAGANSSFQYPMFAQMRAAPTITNNVTGSTNVTTGSSSVTGGTTYTTIVAQCTAAGAFWYSGNFSASADL